MPRLHHSPPWVIVLIIVAAIATPAHADIVDTVRILRTSGCGGIAAARGPLRHSSLLDRAAARWAQGRSPVAAIEQSGYAATVTVTMHLSASEHSMMQLLRGSGCRNLLNPGLRDMGAYRRDLDTWIVLAAGDSIPPRSQAPALAARALELVNMARSRGARCGQRYFDPAPPVKMSSTLENVALGHARDMADHNYFEHQDLAGRTPADRVRATGYQERLVGENIAYGPTSAEEVVRGWLDSPGHCENIMDPRFAEMGLSFASGRSVRHGLYWVQLLAQPRA